MADFCGNCKYLGTVPAHSGETQTVCKRYPPSPLLCASCGKLGYWPVVNTNSPACGEYKHG